MSENSKFYTYMTKKDLVYRKKFIREKFHGPVKDELKEKGYSFSFGLVGSGRRNLVLGNKKKQDYDLDYRLFLTKNNNKNNLRKIKDDFRIAIDNSFVEEGYENGNDSTSVIEVKMLKDGAIDHSFDFAIINRIDKEKYGYILKNNKTQTIENGNYVWEKLTSSKTFNEAYKKIKGSEQWNFLREKYKEKRENNRCDDNGIPKSKDDRLASFLLLHEATNETNDKFN